MDDRRNSSAVVAAHGDIDLDSAPGLGSALSAALRQHGEVVLDLSGVEFMDCRGLAALVRARKQAERSGARLVLRGAGPQVRRLFRLTATDGWLSPEP